MSTSSDRTIVGVALAAALLAVAHAAPRLAQSGRVAAADLFQRALAKERADGKPADAIVLYKQIVDNVESDRALIAKALVQMAGCYERLGKSEDARRAYDRIIREFQDERDAASVAEVRLKGLTAAKVNDRPAVPTIRTTTLPDGGIPSPDGTLVAFSDRGDLAVRKIATGETRRLAVHSRTETACEEFAWSRDAKQLAFNWCYHATPPKRRQYELRVADLDTGAIRVVMPRSESYVTPFDWSLDGRSILTHLDDSPTPDTYELALVSATDGSKRVLKTSESHATPWPENARLSPDGEYVAYTLRSLGRPGKVMVLPVDGSEERPLFSRDSDDQFFGWTPSGRSILFLSDRSRSMDLWTVEVRDGRAAGVAQMTRKDVGDIRLAALTHDGALYYNRPDTYTYDVFVVTLDPKTGDVTSSLAPVTQSNVGRSKAGGWSRDGRFLSYYTASENTRRFDSITVVSLETGEERRIHVQPSIDSIDGVGWTSDGQSFFVNAHPVGADRWGVFKVDARTGAMTKTRIDEVLKGLKLGPDDRTVLFTDTSGNGPALSTIDLVTGQVRALFRGVSDSRVANLALSLDGRQAAFTYADRKELTTRLMVTNITERSTRTIALLQSIDLPANSKLAFSADGHSIYYADRRSAAAKDELWFVSLDGGTPRRLGISPDAAISTLRMHPDGTRLAFSVVQSESAGTIVIEHFLPAAELRAPTEIR